MHVHSSLLQGTAACCCSVQVTPGSQAGHQLCLSFLRLRFLSDGRKFPGCDEALTRKLSESALGSLLFPLEAQGLLGAGDWKGCFLVSMPHSCMSQRLCGPERTEMLAKSRELSHQGKNETLKSEALSWSQIASSKIILHIMK